MTRPLLVVVGDTLLDRDIEGSVRRIAPDAPAPVLDEESVTERPGGAGLAALLAAGHGYDVALVTALADDAGGARLSELLTAAGIDVYALPLPGATPEKVRLRAKGRVMLRLDRGGAARSRPATPRRPPSPCCGTRRRSWSATTVAVSPGTRDCARRSSTPRRRWCGIRTRTARRRCRASAWSPRTRPRSASSPATPAAARR